MCPSPNLSIANPGIADISSLSDRTIYVLGKAPGRTTLTILGGDGRLITNVDVHVTPDIAEFKERLEQILPGEPIEVRTANDGIVLSGTVSSIAKLDRALELASRYAPDRVSNLMSVGGTQQVMLRVRFAEMQRSVSKSLSSSLAVQGSLLNNNLGLSGGTNAANSTAGITNTLGGGLNSSPDANGAMVFGFNAGGLEVGILLEALEARGVVRTLAEPNLTALSGQEATFLAGGEYPVPVAQDGGSITIEYKPFGVELSFIPRVVDGDLINLELEGLGQLDRSDQRLHARRLHHRRLQAPRNLDDRRDARRRELCHCRPAFGRFHRPDRPGAVAGRHPGAWRRCSAAPNSPASRPNWSSSSRRIWSRRPAARRWRCPPTGSARHPSPNCSSMAASPDPRPRPPGARAKSRDRTSAGPMATCWTKRSKKR